MQRTECFNTRTQCDQGGDKISITVSPVEIYFSSNKKDVGGEKMVVGGDGASENGNATLSDLGSLLI